MEVCIMTATTPAGTTIPALLRARSQEEPQRAAILMDGTTSLTFGDWERRSNAMGGVLQQARGAKRGQCIGLFFDNHEWMEYAVAYCGVLKAGAAAVHFSPRMAASEVQRRLEHCDVVGVIYGTSIPPQGRGWRMDVAALESSPPASLNIEIGPEDLADILYTSGTTGTPKGIRVSHGNHTFGREAQVQRIFEKAGHFLGAFPTGTSSSQAMINFAFSGGPTVLVMSSFEPQRICSLIERYKADNLMVAPATVIQLINSGFAQSYDLSSVRMISTGSTYIAPATTKALAEIFPNAKVLTHYGSSESVPALVYAAFDPEHPTSLGRPTPGTEIAICDEKGERLPSGKVGEIWLRSPAPLRSYHKDPERNARVYTDGWIHTGDLGWLDEEGCLHLFDRAADAIRSNGQLVSSLQIEAILYDCPQILEAAVFGMPDPAMGQVIAAAIVLKPGASIEDFRHFIESHLSEQQMPAVIRQFESLPRGLIWKVVKRELRSWFQHGTERGTLVPILSQSEDGWLALARAFQYFYLPI
jgi:acyl-CoA synthetase (AMP-forming)/AMP-acid ligase II